MENVESAPHAREVCAYNPSRPRARLSTRKFQTWPCRAAAAPLESDLPLGGPQSLREGERESENMCVGACV